MGEARNDEPDGDTRRLVNLRALRIGGVLLVHGSSVGSEVIRFFDGGGYSHARRCQVGVSGSDWSEVEA